jgi:hypothetical protein
MADDLEGLSAPIVEDNPFMSNTLADLWPAIVIDTEEMVA